MKYIISESRIENIITKYLQDNPIVEFSDFGADHLNIYLSKTITYGKCRELAHQIKFLFGYEGLIVVLRPSITKDLYLMVGQF